MTVRPGDMDDNFDVFISVEESDVDELRACYLEPSRRIGECWLSDGIVKIDVISRGET